MSIQSMPLEQIARLRMKYPDKVPTYITKLKGSSAPDIIKSKFLVPADIPLSSFMYVIRKWIKVKPEQAIFFFINDTMPSMTMTMEQLYFAHKTETGVLEMTYSAENTFG